MTEADLNQDGVLSYAEFKLILYRVAENPEVQKSYEQVVCKYQEPFQPSIHHS